MEENKIEEPIGKFIIDNAKGTETQNGVYYHYSDVCTLLNKQKEQLILYGVVSSNRYKTDEYLVYTPSDDESVVVIEDTFKTRKTVDIKDFNNLMSVLHSVQDY